MASKKPDWSIILPTLNEGESIGPLLSRLLRLPLARRAEFIIVDGGSIDSTRDAVLQAAKKFKRIYFVEASSGKGLALRIGFSRARGKYLAFMDSDLQYLPEQLPRVCLAIEKGADLAVSCRRVHDGSHVRRALSLGYSKLLGRHLLRLPVSDPQSGMKALRADLLPRLSLQSKGWEFDTELILAAAQAGARIKEVEIDFYPRTSGQTKTHLARTTAQLLHRGISMALSPRRAPTARPLSGPRPPAFRAPPAPFTPSRKRRRAA